MGCENHPDTIDIRYECSGDLGKVFTPYFVELEPDADGRQVHYPHWNGANPAFQPLTVDQNTDTVRFAGYGTGQPVTINEQMRSPRRPAEEAA